MTRPSWQRFRSFARGSRRVRGLGPNPVIELPPIGQQRLEFGSCGFCQVGSPLAAERVRVPDELRGIMVRIKETWGNARWGQACFKNS